MIRFSLSALVFALSSLAAAGPASAQDAAEPLRPYCTTRPSLGAGACIADIGHPMLEMGVGDWQRDRSDGSRTDLFVTGDALLRVGVGRATEVQLGWTALGHERTRDAGGAVDRRTGIGDVSVAVRQNLLRPDGGAFSAAVQPFVTLPTGGGTVGAGTWSAGVVLPAGYQLNDSVELQFTGEADAAADADGGGRHFAYSAIGGIALTLSETVSTTVELSAARDRDPDGSATILLAALSGGYQVAENAQVDAGTAIGLNAASPDVRVFFGFSRRF